MKILLIEDELIPLMVLQWTLCDHGHEVLATSRAQEAIEKGIPFEPDLIVADWNLRDTLDGVEVCRSILEARPEVKVILVSGSPEAEINSIHKDFIPARFISKPCDPEYVAQVVESTARCVEYPTVA